jgi:hypothetical protein
MRDGRKIRKMARTSKRVDFLGLLRYYVSMKEVTAPYWHAYWAPPSGAVE